MNFRKWQKLGGTDVPKHKSLTMDQPIQEAPVPKELYFPMAMHIGAPAKTEVRVGDVVKIGTILGSSDGKISTNVHSSVSGEVIRIEEINSLRTKTQAVVVANDLMDEEICLDPMTVDVTPEDFVERLEWAGITGKGGAGFPTAVKFDMKREEVDYVVINGAECEPYSTTDYRVMIESAKEIIQMIQLTSSIYHVKKSIIAVEEPMKEAISALEQAIDELSAYDVTIHRLSSKYPQGHAGLQIREVLGIEIAEGQRSGDVGVLQTNVSTIKAIYDAFYRGKAFTSRVITITGPMIKEPKNCRVRIGTPIQSLIDYCGGLKEGSVQMINGGPMMGKSFEEPQAPVDKDTTTLLFLKKQKEPEEGACIRCARCIEHCPVDLQPIHISNSYRKKQWFKGEKLYAKSCISCGTCTFVCPSRIPLLKDIQAMNQQLEKRNEKK